MLNNFSAGVDSLGESIQLCGGSIGALGDQIKNWDIIYTHPQLNAFFHWHNHLCTEIQAYMKAEKQC